jgi:hypothetical protein
LFFTAVPHTGQKNKGRLASRLEDSK